MIEDIARKTNTDSPTELLELIRFSSYLLDHLNEGILIADHNCIVRYVNSRYTKITGVKFDEIVGRPLLEPFSLRLLKKIKLLKAFIEKKERLNMLLILALL
jgi:PAS domain S-box-containing protein